MLEPERDRRPAPHGRLPEQHELGDRLEVLRLAVWHGELREPREQRERDDDPGARIANQLDDHVVELIRRPRGQRAESRREELAQQQPERGDDDRRDAGGQPDLQRIVEELSFEKRCEQRR